MATKIKLMRIGKMREPHYRIVVADARTKRDGRSIETIGEYHPKSDPSLIKLDGERAAYWLGVGAQPTEAVTAIMKATGDWQKFKGLPAGLPSADLLRGLKLPSGPGGAASQPGNVPAGFKRRGQSKSKRGNKR